MCPLGAEELSGSDFPQPLQVGETFRGVVTDQREQNNSRGPYRVIDVTNADNGDVRSIFERAPLARLMDAVQPGDFLEISLVPENGRAAPAAPAGRGWKSQRQGAAPAAFNGRTKYVPTLWQVMKREVPDWASDAMKELSKATSGLPLEETPVTEASAAAGKKAKKT